MKSLQAHSAEWNFGPVRIWLRPHLAGQRGEPPARELLAQTLALTPEAVPLTRDARGRPWLLPPLAHLGVGWSHSGDQLLVGLGERMRLGVDLERQRPRAQMREIARRFFHPQETAWLERLDEAACTDGFFRLWCAKEALLKAHGHGLSFGLHRLHLADRDGVLTLVWCDPALGEAAEWRLHEWQPMPDYRAALAWYPQPDR